jgi:hypothetical protein
MPTQDSFEPELYLAIMHGDTTLSDLKTGRANLKFEVSERTGQLKDLVSQPAAFCLLGPIQHYRPCERQFCYATIALLQCKPNQTFVTRRSHHGLNLAQTSGALQHVP